MAWIARSFRISASACCTQLACAQTPPSYDFDFATVTAVGNAAWSGADPLGAISGRGSVGYEYRISRLETTTAQWMEFINTFSVQPALAGPGGPSVLWGPLWWGAVPDPGYIGPGRRFQLDPSVPAASRLPVIGMSWREAALFCNWLHHEKTSNWQQIQTGAYDSSTFTTNPDGTINDQRTHSPGARFWIPTLDEWLKAAHYDPNRNGPGQEGWWEYSHSSDIAPVPGLPGIGETSATLLLPGFEEFSIPLGSYPEVTSPWGLLDTSGGAKEWLEEIWVARHRMYDGTRAGLSDPDLDRAWLFGAEMPQVQLHGLRIASSVPAPSTGIILVLLLVPVKRRARTEHPRVHGSRT